jgi:hypothetical protein
MQRSKEASKQSPLFKSYLAFDVKVHPKGLAV